VSTARNRQIACRVFEEFLSNPDSVASEDLVALRWRLTGIDLGLVPGRPATRRPIVENGMAFLRIKDDKVVERWATVDRLGVMQEIGRLPINQD